MIARVLLGLVLTLVVGFALGASQAPVWLIYLVIVPLCLATSWLIVAARRRT